MIYLIFSVFFIKAVEGYNVTDKIHFRIDWREALTDTTKSDHITMVTVLGEKYDCKLSSLLDLNEQTEDHGNESKSEMNALQDLRYTYPCAFRGEFYWSYEVCHLKKIRQYHEELLLDKSSSVQEYILGEYDTSEHRDVNSSSKIDEITLGEYVYPYFSVNYTGGTYCDLTNVPRSASVLYICMETLTNQILEISEIESCQYRIIVATHHFCSVPGYKRHRSHVNQISCQPHQSTPVKPVAFVTFESERQNLVSNVFSNIAGLFSNVDLQNVRVDTLQNQDSIVYRIHSGKDSSVDQPVSPRKDIPTAGQTERNAEELDENNETGGDTVIVNSRDSTDTSRPSKSFANQPARNQHHSKAAQSESLRLVEAFIGGHDCLEAEAGGWWTHTFCFNGKIHQFHKHSGSVTQKILIGQWDEQVHRRWIAENPSRRPALDPTSRRSVTLFYGGGDDCDETGVPRQTIVKLQCLPSALTSIHVSFSEPNLCHYSFLIESANLCDILKDSDEDGVLRVKSFSHY